MLKRHSRVLLVILLIVVIIATLLSVFSNRVSFDSSTFNSDSESSNSIITISPQTNATVDFESTAVALFTANPRYSLSSTPYYAEILYNQAIYQLTQTPTIDRSGLTPNCSLVADFREIRDLSDIVMQSFDNQSISIFMRTFTSGVWGVDANCSEFFPVFTRIRIWVEMDGNGSASLVSETVANIIRLINENISQADMISPVLSNINLSIYFGYEEQQLGIFTTWLIAQQSYLNGLRGEDLIDALGGVILLMDSD